MAYIHTRLVAFVILIQLVVTNHIPDHAPAKRCRSDAPLCLPNSEASCHGEKCVCKDGFGNGHFSCHSEQQEYCHIMNDPVTFTFGKERFDIPVPCRFMVTEVSADFRYNDKWIASQCHTKVHASNSRSKGKFFVSSFDVFADFYSGSNTKQVFFRASGRATAGIYTFDLSMKHSKDVIIPFTSTIDLKELSKYMGPVKFEIEKHSKRVHLSIPKCALDIVFRPADSTFGKDQDMMPGLSIAYDKTYDLSWWNVDSSICLTPDHTKSSTGSVAEITKMRPTEAFVWRAFLGDSNQLLIDSHNTYACLNIVDNVKKCATARMHQEASSMCSFMLETELFVNCISGDENYTSEAVGELYSDCLEAFCTRNDMKCQMIKTQIHMLGCDKYMYDAFAEHACKFSSTLQYQIRR